ncbi:hypothetical protein FGO68_gene10737 [Halteria grandinella]|uniref:LITAF domain-containing protein n=1 Tax=Halteria grandinella TaxID=5974 RepID=A0A8J8P144_HALGN|nr:hypothetical protein FGO68_gene10737 [Halteria grandinella]
MNPQSAFLNALKIKNRPGSSQIGAGNLIEGPAKRLTLDENGRIVEADDFNNNVRLPPEIPQLTLKRSLPSLPPPIPVDAKPLPLIPPQTITKQKKKLHEPFSFKTGSITRQDDFDIDQFGWNYEATNTLQTQEVHDDLKELRLKKLSKGRSDFTNVRIPTIGYCKRCNDNAMTITSLSCTGRQWCYSAILTGIGCLWFTCVPFLVGDCYNVRHNCGKCGKYLGSSL